MAAVLLATLLAAPVYVAPVEAEPQQKKTTKQPVRRSYGVPAWADSTKDDIAAFDDPVVREVAVEALGRRNGSVVAVDPQTGRILTIVNQRMAFSEGFQPCSTFKPVVGLAGLEEGVIKRDTLLRVAPRRFMNLTEALAHSNNPFFEVIGEKMGFEKVSHYGKLFGLGEPAGLNIFEEHPGVFPAEPPAYGGVGRMSSYGEGIRMTPLQLASLTATFANGGTVYYLQYPRTEEARRNFQPVVKRHLNIESLVPDVREGLRATVLYGTGKSSFSSEGEDTLGKTGTCRGQGSRIGWFASYYDQFHPRLVLVVLLRGGSTVVNGPSAAEISGKIYQRLRERQYFANGARAQASTGSSH